MTSPIPKTSAGGPVADPACTAFPQNDPQVYELYWSAPQLRARAHPNLLRAQAALMNLWHLSDPESQISLSQPLAYADRLRIRQPGDAKFALGPHIDGGSVERWEEHGYGRGNVYDRVFEGRWEEYDPWDASTRVPAVVDNYGGLGACTMFRMFQGWVSMSHTGPREGTLLVNPLLQLSTAYVLLRPFFQPVRAVADISAAEFLGAANWEFSGDAMTSELQGATPGHGQELSDALHPHLELENSMVHMPQVKPGDFVVWHCDSRSPPSHPSLPSLTPADRRDTSHPRGRQGAQRQGRRQRAVHPRLPRDRDQRELPKAAARGLPQRHAGPRLPRRRGREPAREPAGDRLPPVALGRQRTPGRRVRAAGSPGV